MSSLRYITVAVLSLGALAAVDIRQPMAAVTHRMPSPIQEPVEAALATQNLRALQTETRTPEGSALRNACPSDMVEVEGDYCPAPEQICDEYISEKRDRCVRFRAKVRCLGTQSPRHFCIDRYEYPNEAGKRPTVSVTWDEARDLCANEGKRLCATEEWTLACEGPQAKPYPFGYTRDATACNIDKPYIIPNQAAYDSPKTRAEEIARVNQSEPSGARHRCVSDYGVYDMTGNVDEWVVNERGSARGPEFQSGLKGGYWGPVRNRCRPTTTDHNHWHHGYQIGFRCCKDPVEVGPRPESTPATPGADPGLELAGPEATEPSRS